MNIGIFSFISAIIIGVIVFIIIDKISGNTIAAACVAIAIAILWCYTNANIVFPKRQSLGEREITETRQLAKVDGAYLHLRGTAISVYTIEDDDTITVWNLSTANSKIVISDNAHVEHISYDATAKIFGIRLHRAVCEYILYIPEE